MNSYRKIKLLIFTILVSYFIFGAVLQLFVPGKNEVFPVFSWALFAKVPNSKKDYNIQIISVNNNKLATPVYYNDSFRWFANTNSIDAYYVIQKLGYAVSTGDENSTQEIRNYFEPLYMGDAKKVNYRLVSRDYNPLKYWKFGKIESIRILDSFEYHRNKK